MEIREATRPAKTASAAQTMQAAVITAPGEIRIRSVAVPEPGSDEVRIRLEGCGICASSLPVWEGREWFEYPCEPGMPGHEGWGVIDKTGPRVTRFKRGDKVAVLSYRAFAEYDIAPAEAVIKLPPAVESRGFPGEPLACAMNVFGRSDIRENQQIAIIGVGFLGAVLIQMAKNAGAKVIAVSRRPFALKTARKMGADIIIPYLSDHQRIVGKIKMITGGNLCERVIEATGEQGPLDLAAELTSVRGKLVVAGYHQDGLRRVNMQLWNWRGLDVINAHERDPHQYMLGMKKAIDVVAAKKINLWPLLTHRFRLSNLDRGFEMLRERPDGFLKAMVTL